MTYPEFLCTGKTRFFAFLKKIVKKLSSEVFTSFKSVLIKTQVLLVCCFFLKSGIREEFSGFFEV